MAKLDHQDGALFWRILENLLKKVENYWREDERCNGRITAVVE